LETAANLLRLLMRVLTFFQMRLEIVELSADFDSAIRIIRRRTADHASNGHDKRISVSAVALYCAQKTAFGGLSERG
jgi:hypothetical protein